MLFFRHTFGEKYWQDQLQTFAAVEEDPYKKKNGGSEI